MSQMVLAASLAKLDRIEEAQTAAARVLDLQPGYRYGLYLTGSNFNLELAASMGEALRTAGLPEIAVRSIFLERSN